MHVQTSPVGSIHDLAIQGSLQRAVRAREAAQHAAHISVQAHDHLAKLLRIRDAEEQMAKIMQEIVGVRQEQTRFNRATEVRLGELYRSWAQVQAQNAQSTSPVTGED